MPATVNRCSRCNARFTTEPYLMAGRPYCCKSCSVGSACSHQGIYRPTAVRRYDTTFDRFQQVATSSTPYEPREAREQA